MLKYKSVTTGVVHVSARSDLGLSQMLCGLSEITDETLQQIYVDGPITCESCKTKRLQILQVGESNKTLGDRYMESLPSEPKLVEEKESNNFYVTIDCISGICMLVLPKFNEIIQECLEDMGLVVLFVVKGASTLIEGWSQSGLTREELCKISIFSGTLEVEYPKIFSKLNNEIFN